MDNNNPTNPTAEPVSSHPKTSEEDSVGNVPGMTTLDGIEDPDGLVYSPKEVTEDTEKGFYLYNEEIAEVPNLTPAEVEDYKFTAPFAFKGAGMPPPSEEELFEFTKHSDSEPITNVVHSAVESKYDEIKHKDFEFSLENNLLDLSDPKAVQAANEHLQAPAFTVPQSAYDYMFGVGLLEDYFKPFENLMEDYSDQPGTMDAALNAADVGAEHIAFQQAVERVKGEFNGRKLENLYYRDDAEKDRDTYWDMGYFHHKNMDRWRNKIPDWMGGKVLNLIPNFLDSEFVSDVKGVFETAAGWEMRDLKEFGFDESQLNPLYGAFRDNYQRIRSLPLEQQEEALRDYTERLVNEESSSPLAVLIPGRNFGVLDLFWDYVDSYSTQRDDVRHLMAMIDVAGGFVAAGAAKASKAAISKGASVTRRTADLHFGATDRMKDIGESLLSISRINKLRRRGDASVHEMTAMMGDIDTSSRMRVLQLLQEGGMDTEQAASLLPRFYNANAWLSSSGNIDGEAARRIAQNVYDSDSQLLFALGAHNNINRLTSTEQANAVIAHAKKMVDIQYSDEADRILDADWRFIPGTNTYKVDVNIGQRDGTFFSTRREAEHIAKRFDNARVEPEGNAYVVKIETDANEVDTIVHNIPLSKAQKVHIHEKESLFNHVRMMARHFAGTDNRVSETTRAAMKKKQGVENELKRQLAEANHKMWVKFGHRVKKDINEFWERDRRYTNTITKPDGTKEVIRGRFADDATEFDHRFQQFFGRKPTADHYEAYLGRVRLNDIDFARTNLNLYKEKTSAGIRLYDITVDTGETLDGIEGKLVDDLDWANKEEAGILITGGNPSFHFKNANRDITKGVIQAKLKEGFKVIQLSDEGASKLKSFQKNAAEMGDENATYALVPGNSVMKSRNLPYQQIPYRPGGHIMYADGFFVASPTLTKLLRGGAQVRRYDGDFKISHFRTRARAQQYADKLDQVRQMIKSGAPTRETFRFIREHFDKRPQEIYRLFHGSEAKLSLDEKIDIVAFGENLKDKHRLLDKHPDILNDDGSSYKLYTGMNSQFAGKRGAILKTQHNVQSAETPYFVEEEAALLDANDTMRRSFSHIVDSSMSSDIKFREARNWVSQFKHLLHDEDGDLLTNPVKHAMNPEIKAGTGSLMERLAAQQSNKSLRQFLGEPTVTARMIQNYKHDLLDHVVTVAPNSKLTNILENHLMMSTNDPARFLRSFAFHTSLGMFSPSQLVLQASSFAHIGMISPKHAPKGLSGYTYARAVGYNRSPDIRKYTAKQMKHFGWDVEQLEQGRQMMRLMGQDVIGGEVSVRLDSAEPSFVQTKVGSKTKSFMNWSTAFFDEGERLPRVSAWFTAWSELAAKKGVKKGKLDITPADEEWLLNRADDLAINMTRASSAVWQRGWASVPTQFWSYAARMMDQMLGHRLTKMEKLRIFSGYSALYGLPTGAGAFGGLVPLHEMLQTELQARGWDEKIEDNPILKMLSTGTVTMASEWLTGVEYDAASRFGPAGLAQIWEFWTGKKSVPEFIGGAGYSRLKDGWQRSSGLREDIFDMLTLQRPQGEEWLQSLDETLRTFTSYNHFTKAWVAWRTGEVLSSRGTLVNEIDENNLANIIFRLSTGATPVEEQKAWRSLDIAAAEKKARSELAAKVVENQIKAFSTGDQDLRDKYKRRSDQFYELGELWRYPGIKRSINERVLEALEGSKKSRVDTWKEERHKISPEHYEREVEKRRETIPEGF